MRFDYSKGKEARYLVAIHYETTDDYYFFHYYADAKLLFKNCKENNGAKIRTLVLSDLKLDVRKDFFRGGAPL